MTQIVYDGQALYADRKMYASGMYAGETLKLKSTRIDGVLWYYAFAGGLADCAIGEAIIASGFDLELRQQAVERLGAERLNEEFMGIVVRMNEFETSQTAPSHRVFLSNYAGELCEMVPGTFLAVGALEQTIRDFKRGADYMRDLVMKKNGIITPWFNTEDIIRNALVGSSQDQSNFHIDKVVL